MTKRVPKGLSVGNVAPEIHALSTNGAEINSNDILAEKSIVLIFCRGKRCPVCNRYLNNLNDSLSLITERAEVIVVGPEIFNNAEKSLSRTGGEFVLIPDPNLKILSDYDVLFNVTKSYQQKIKTFRMTDIAKNNNNDEAILPVPATYIIGKSGKIIYCHFDFDYTIRASFQEIVEHLE